LDIEDDDESESSDSEYSDEEEEAPDQTWRVRRSGIKLLQCIF